MVDMVSFHMFHHPRALDLNACANFAGSRGSRRCLATKQCAHPHVGGGVAAQHTNLVSASNGSAPSWAIRVTDFMKLPNFSYLFAARRKTCAERQYHPATWKMRKKGTSLKGPRSWPRHPASPAMAATDPAAPAHRCDKRRYWHLMRSPVGAMRSWVVCGQAQNCL